MPVLIPGATQQSGATKSKMARAIYHRCSCPISAGWDEKYALKAIKHPVCLVSSLVDRVRRLCRCVATSFLCLFFFVTNYPSSLRPPPISLHPICLPAFPLRADEIATGPAYWRKERRDKKEMAGDKEKWLSVRVVSSAFWFHLLSVCKAVIVETTPSRRNAQITESCCQQIVCLEMSITRCLPQRRWQPNQNCVNNN